MTRTLPLLVLLLAACSQKTDPNPDPVAIATETASEPLSPGARAVRIGENGAQFAACGTAGEVVNLSPGGERTLPVRAAPFDDAEQTAALGNGARLYVCTRSIDQGWLGVVSPPAATPSADCGVTAPVAGVRDYAGPCAAGWVASAFVRLRAG